MFMVEMDRLDNFVCFEVAICEGLRIPVVSLEVKV
jgi:hypothetical protein